MLNYMEYVYSVHLNRSFSKAAEDLYISQPALSAAIKRVEEQIGLPIFDRSTYPITLTLAGEYYIKSIESIMEIQKEMEEYFNNLKEEHEGTIKVGGPAFFCTYVLPIIANKFVETFPNYNVNILEANAGDLLKYLQEDLLDVIIDVENSSFPKNINSLFLSEEHILLAVPESFEVNNELKKYRLTFNDVASGRYLKNKYPKVNLSAFKNEEFVLLKEGNDLHDRSLNMTKRAGFTPKVVMYLDQLLTSYYVALNGVGIAFVRAGVSLGLDATNKLYFYKIDDESSQRDIMLYYKNNDLLSKGITKFLNFSKLQKNQGLIF